jgi:uncharacterized membrane protein
MVVALSGQTEAINFMYKIIGGDGSEYGPVSAETLRQWYAEGRVNGQTKVRRDDGEWLPMSAFPVFASLLAQPSAAAASVEPVLPPTPPPFPTGTAAGGQTPVPEGDYELDIGRCVTRGWELVKANFGILFGGLCLYFVVTIGLGALSNIPFIGMVFSIAGFFVGGPMLGGLYYLYLKVARGRPAEVGEVFAGLQRAFLQLFLGQFVPSLFIVLCMLPAIITLFIVFLPVLNHGQFLQDLMHHQSTDQQQLWQELSQQLAQVTSTQWLLVGGVCFACAIPVCFLKVSWMFALPLIIDKEMNFWTAMKTSWQRVNRHWWLVFGLIAVAAVIAMVGFLACCVGVIVTMPIEIAVLMFAYETIFSGRND